MHKKRGFSWCNVSKLIQPERLIVWIKQLLLKNNAISNNANGTEVRAFRKLGDDFWKKHGRSPQKIVLGVAFAWGERKGLDVFIALSKRLDEKYQIVMVGTNDDLDKHLPGNIISIHRTHNQCELAEIYSVADVFVNPTREDTFPTVNMEALACGTPVVTFDTGGSPESLDETCGIVVPRDDVDALEAAIRYVCEKKPFNQDACIARAKHFVKDEKFQEYIDLYHTMMKKGRKEL